MPLTTLPESLKPTSFKDSFDFETALHSWAEIHKEVGRSITHWQSAIQATRSKKPEVFSSLSGYLTGLKGNGITMEGLLKKAGKLGGSPSDKGEREKADQKEICRKLYREHGLCEIMVNGMERQCPEYAPQSGKGDAASSSSAGKTVTKCKY
ncbi:hypothetical protein S7711_10713 [Stachybotrys chartarum IBT 7711]|uniref:Uncharacterized protein n=1 Tax=Stachybotrys chartarum (strain CBS 109288 / IBT 7711) TaxID=1280523 RepID=A0A084AXY5_STACB|nr:hypothetical protein S7711_10713 [Stachybotrys chartarum IBT 7711]KFA46864.1 hypothetical protein S40293_10969 [Stachybotrys chartarum IBT 40293]KFA72585.1 hypothetical protein S40288_11178 [Stachybotrys chartarum IBT 40288]